MSPLAEVQRAFAQAVLSGDVDRPGLPAFVGRVSPTTAFRIHQGTTLVGLTSALRLTFPTVDVLVGQVFFDHAALAFISREPPMMANLSAYGRGYPEFLRTFEPAGSLPYLADVASFDLVIDGVQRLAVQSPFDYELDEGVALSLAATLRLLQLSYPADSIRERIDAGDLDGLANIDMAPAPITLAVWRGLGGSRVRRLSAPAARFLNALLSDQTPAQALAAADDGVDGAALAAIHAEVLTAPFASITTSRQETAL